MNKPPILDLVAGVKLLLADLRLNPDLHPSLCCRVRCHIVHLSSAQPLQLIREAREAGAPLTVETTHHYLSLTAEDVPSGATQFKCCPPIRGAENQVSGHHIPLARDELALIILLLHRRCCGRR